MSKVRIEIGTKINLGNFETFSLNVGVEDETKLGETTGQAFERVFKFVDDKLGEKVEEIKQLRQE